MAQGGGSSFPLADEEAAADRSAGPGSAVLTRASQLWNPPHRPSRSRSAAAVAHGEPFALGLLRSPADSSHPSPSGGIRHHGETQMQETGPVPPPQTGKHAIMTRPAIPLLLSTRESRKQTLSSRRDTVPRAAPCSIPRRWERPDIRRREDAGRTWCAAQGKTFLPTKEQRASTRHGKGGPREQQACRSPSQGTSSVSSYLRDVSRTGMFSREKARSSDGGWKREELGGTTWHGLFQVRTMMAWEQHCDHA